MEIIKKYSLYKIKKAVKMTIQRSFLNPVLALWEFVRPEMFVLAIKSWVSHQRTTHVRLIALITLIIR